MTMERLPDSNRSAIMVDPSRIPSTTVDDVLITVHVSIPSPMATLSPVNPLT